MPKYYFNIADDQSVIRDEEGTDLPDLGAARQEAQEAARDVLVDTLRAHNEIDHKRIELTDDKGTVLGVFNVRDMLN